MLSLADIVWDDVSRGIFNIPESLGRTHEACEDRNDRWTEACAKLRPGGRFQESPHA